MSDFEIALLVIIGIIFLAFFVYLIISAIRESIDIYKNDISCQISERTERVLNKRLDREQEERERLYAEIQAANKEAWEAVTQMIAVTHDSNYYGRK